jgi:hypothetical protein
MKNNAILVYAKADTAHHLFCTAQHAEQELKRMAQNNECGSMFTSDADLDQELVYASSSALRDHVDQAKTKLLQQTKLARLMDKHAIPSDRALRGSIWKCFSEMSAA